ncbi:MAG TPA: hypothetical protein VGH85_01020 [Mycobacteriales bacterium]
MLRALGHPASFFGLLIGYLLAVLVHRTAQQVAARMLGDRSLRTTGHPIATYVDPFGAVAAALGGIGWGESFTVTLRSRGRRAIALLAGPVAVAALAAAALIGFRAAGGAQLIVAQLTPGDVIGGVDLVSTGQTILLCAGLEAAGMAVLGLVPLPPLTGWRVLSLFMRETHGWQRTRIALEDRNIGVAILLVLLVLPIGPGGPLLVRLLNVIVGAVLRAVFG